MMYVTKFVKHRGRLFIFYKYDTCGYVPVEVSFVHRKKEYGTIQVMQLLAKLALSKRELPRDVKFEAKDWFAFDQAKFVEFQNLLTRACR